LIKMDVYLETGKKRTFAGAIDWPGWCRSGGNEQAALQALLKYAPRYAQIFRTEQLGFQEPAGIAELHVVERLKGNVTTDFGAPGLAPASDTQPLSEAEVQRCQLVLKACWRAFDAAIQAAAGKELRKGQRGGGRDMEGMLQHVLGGDAAYLARVGWKLTKVNSGDPGEQLEHTRQSILSALLRAARGEVPAQGPRSGARWTPRYFVRRVAWHVLDHAWELEDRIL
jgi:hypothetical protein